MPGILVSSFGLVVMKPRLSTWTPVAGRLRVGVLGRRPAAARMWDAVNAFVPLPEERLRVNSMVVGLICLMD